MDERVRLRDLKAFLRARRAALTPTAAGLPTTARRKLSGLRREEVASLADVGLTWYTWLEQGRPIRVSREVLGRIANALRLSPSDTAYLFALAAVDDPPATALPEFDDRLRLVMDSIDRAPAWVVNPLFYIVAFNRLADLIYRFEEVSGPFANNHLWRLFGDPKRARLYDRSWDEVAASGVGMLRVNYAAHAGNPAFDALLAALREFPEFVRLWEAQYTAPMSQVLIGDLYRSDLGRLRLRSLRLLVPDLPGFVLFVLPPADQQTALVLRRLVRSVRRGSSDSK